MQIIFAEGSTPLSRLIQKLTLSKYSHCAIRYSHPEEQWLVHAFGAGVIPEWFFYFKNKYKSIRVYDCLFKEGDEALDRVVKKIGHAPYDYSGLIGHGIALAFGLKHNPFGSRRKYKCTELITAWHDECMVLNKYLNIPFFNSELITPEFLIRLYDSRKDLFRLVQ